MQALSNLVIRPNRSPYTLSDLGPRSFTVNNHKITRKDFQIPSIRGLLKCSWFQPQNSSPHPCIIYCHGNSGGRADSLDIRDFVLQYNYSLFCFDFGGCGQSDGDYVTLGYFQQQDISSVVNYLKHTGRVSFIVLWGRSMGAAAVMLYTARNPIFPVVVVDSPFASLNELTTEMVQKFKLIPQSLKKALMTRLKIHIRQIAGFSLDDVEPLRAFDGLTIPCVIIHSSQDSLIHIGHAKRVFEALKGPKFFLEVGGHHNDERPPHITVRALSIVQYFFSVTPVMEDGYSTIRGELPGIKEKHRRYRSCPRKK